MILDDFFKELKGRVELARREIQREQLGFVREQEFRNEGKVIIMNETDFLEPEESGEIPVDMYNIDDDENVRRRDAKIEAREKVHRIFAIIAGKARSL